MHPSEIGFTNYVVNQFGDFELGRHLVRLPWSETRERLLADANVEKLTGNKMQCCFESIPYSTVFHVTRKTKKNQLCENMMRLTIIQNFQILKMIDDPHQH